MGRGGEWLQLFRACSCRDDQSLSNGQGTDSHTSSHVPNASCAVHSHASPNLTHTTPLRVGPGDPAVRPSCLPTCPQPLPPVLVVGLSRTWPAYSHVQAVALSQEMGGERDLAPWGQCFPPPTMRVTPPL